MIVYGQKYNVSIFKTDLMVSFDHPTSVEFFKNASGEKVTKQLMKHVLHFDRPTSKKEFIKYWYNTTHIIGTVCMV